MIKVWHLASCDAYQSVTVVTHRSYSPARRYCKKPLMGAFHGSYVVALAIWDHTVLPATRHKWIHSALTPARQAGTRFTYPGGMEGWVDLVDLIAPRPGVEPATFRSRVQRSTNAQIELTSAQWQTGKVLFSVLTSGLLYYVGMINEQFSSQSFPTNFIGWLPQCSSVHCCYYHCNKLRPRYLYTV